LQANIEDGKQTILLRTRWIIRACFLMPFKVFFYVHSSHPWHEISRGRGLIFQDYNSSETNNTSHNTTLETSTKSTCVFSLYRTKSNCIAKRTADRMCVTPRRKKKKQVVLHYLLFQCHFFG
jgi:hypothetical protein